MRQTSGKRRIRVTTGVKKEGWAGLALALLLPVCAAWGASPATSGVQVVSNETYTLTLTASPDRTAICRGKPVTFTASLRCSDPDEAAVSEKVIIDVAKGSGENVSGYGSVSTSVTGTQQGEGKIAVTAESGVGKGKLSLSRSIDVISVVIKSSATSCVHKANAQLKIDTTQSYSPDDGYGWFVAPEEGLDTSSILGLTFDYSPVSSDPGIYTVTAKSVTLPACQDSCAVHIVKVSLDTPKYVAVVGGTNQAAYSGGGNEPLQTMSYSPTGSGAGTGEGTTAPGIAVRVPLTVNRCEPPDWDGGVTLLWSAGNIKIYNAPSNGVELLSGITFANMALPTNLWVEGNSPSVTTNDVAFRLNPVEAECPNAGGGCASGTMTVVGAWLKLPEVVGVNDFVPNCTDMSGRNKWYNQDLTTAPQYVVEGDLFPPQDWDVAPRDESLGEINIKGDGERIRVLALKDGNLVVNPAFPPIGQPAEFKLEGVGHSIAPDDAIVELTYSVCTVTARTTVVQVDLDKPCYNRADPYPEVEIISVSNLTPGGTATVIYKVLDDMLDVNVPQLSNTFTVATTFGTYEYKTPPYINRIGNSGHDAIRYTVYDDHGTKAVRWSHADPDRRALVELPASAQMQIEIKDALAATPEEAPAHLVSIPSFAGTINATGTCPAYVIADIKVLAKTPSPAYANEICPEVGNETILQTLHNVAQASAVVLEITGSRVVSVNDRFGTGDPGDDALEDRDTTDPDFIELKLGGFPDCVTEGTIEWEVTANARCIRLVSAPAAAQVGSKVIFGFNDGLADYMRRVFIEGRAASEEINDVTVTVRIIIDDSEANPSAFRGQTLAADFRLTVTDLRWTGWEADNVAGKSDERMELLVCDLDLRPAVRLDQPQGGTTFTSGSDLTVAGTVRSMADIVSDIRVNGETVSLSDIRFLGVPLAGLTSVSDLTDQPPPYIVTFTHTLTQFDGNEVKVEARNSVATSPGYAGRAVNYNATTGTVSAALIASPEYGEPGMVDFFDGAGGWKFLYKTEVDHCGAGAGVVECVETCGAQPGNGLFRLRQPLIFVSAADKHPSLAAPGLFIRNGLIGQPSAEYDNGVNSGVKKLFPVNLTVADGGGTVLDDEEWWRGAWLGVGDTNGALTVANPFGQDDIPDDAELTLEVADVDKQANPFTDFTNLCWTTESADDFSEPIKLNAPTKTGAAAFILTLSSAKYGLLGKDRVKVSVGSVNLVIDSLNQYGYNIPVDSEEVERVEDDATLPGKALAINHLDCDKDGIPDYADGFDIVFDGVSQAATNASHNFVPVILEFATGIDITNAAVVFKGEFLSNPATDVIRSGNGTASSPYSYNITGGGRVRLWCGKNGSDSRCKASVTAGGDAILKDEAIPLYVLSPSNGVVRLYLEALGRSADIGDIRLGVELNPRGSISPSPISDWVRATVFEVEKVHPLNVDFTPGQEGKVLISAKHGGGYHTTNQTADARVRITASVKPIPTASSTNLVVYFEVTDPDDLSHYEGKSTPGTPNIQGDENPNDNRDTARRMTSGTGADYTAYQNACLTAAGRTASVTVTSQTAIAETTLLITDRYSGDNYQVRATTREPHSRGSFDTRTSWTTNAPHSVSSIAESATMIAWKRVYIEQDNMYTLGATITANAPAGATTLMVDSSADFGVGDAVVVFWPSGTFNTTITATNANSVTIANGLPQAVTPYAGIRPQAEPGTYTVDRRYLKQAFGDAPDGSDGGAFIEFMDAPSGSGKVPKYSVFPNSQTELAYATYWYYNLWNKDLNILHLLAARREVSQSLGVHFGIRRSCIIYVLDNTGQQADGSLVMPEIQREETVSHEIGHRFGLAPSLGGNYSYIDGVGNNQLSHDGAEICIMSYDNVDNVITEFSVECLLIGSYPNAGNSLRDINDN